MTHGPLLAAEGRTGMSSAAGPPPTFDPAQIAELPEPARRWLTAAIEPGTPLWDSAEITMHGEIRLHGWRPFTAVETLTPDHGFVWAGRSRYAGLRVAGRDELLDGEGLQKWRVAGLPLLTATGPDVTRSAADRLAGECVLLPTSLVTAEWRHEAEPDTASYVRQVAGRFARTRVTIRVDAIGRIDEVTLSRWGAPQGGHYAAHDFRVRLAGSRRIGGIAIPLVVTAAWRRSDGCFADFYLSVVDDVSFRWGEGS